MKKIMIIGCPGSGKSTFARKLNQITQIPLYHCDMLYWNSDKSYVSKEEFTHRLQTIMDNDQWIIDGNYGSTMKMRLDACDTVFFLDMSLDVCLSGLESRKGQAREDMPWSGSDEQLDEELLQFVLNYTTINRPTVLELLSESSNKTIKIFTHRDQLDEYLNQLIKVSSLIK